MQAGRRGLLLSWDQQAKGPRSGTRHFLCGLGSEVCSTGTECRGREAAPVLPSTLAGRRSSLGFGSRRRSDGERPEPEDRPLLPHGGRGIDLSRGVKEITNSLGEGGCRWSQPMLEGPGSPRDEMDRRHPLVARCRTALCPQAPGPELKSPDLSAQNSQEPQHLKERGPGLQRKGLWNQTNGLGMQRALWMAGAWGAGAVSKVRAWVSCAPGGCGRAV